MQFYETDLISVLANLYGSQEDFIKEYQVNLAMKFINNRNQNYEEEFKNIELLKQRFGENKLNTCEIILRDVKESKRINNLISNNGLPINMSALIVSKEFWPINGEEQN